jgi:hypothetical protein
MQINFIVSSRVIVRTKEAISKAINLQFHTSANLKWSTFSLHLRHNFTCCTLILVPTLIEKVSHIFQKNSQTKKCKK